MTRNRDTHMCVRAWRGRKSVIFCDIICGRFDITVIWCICPIACSLARIEIPLSSQIRKVLATLALWDANIHLKSCFSCIVLSKFRRFRNKLVLCPCCVSVAVRVLKVACIRFPERIRFRCLINTCVSFAANTSHHGDQCQHPDS